MQIKKTRLKQIIAEEIARFDALTEEEKVEEAWQPSLGLGLTNYGKMKKAARQAEREEEVDSSESAPSPTSEDSIESDKTSEKGKGKKREKKLIKKIIKKADEMDKEVLAKTRDYTIAQRNMIHAEISELLANLEAQDAALKSFPGHLVGSSDFIKKIAKATVAALADAADKPPSAGRPPGGIGDISSATGSKVVGEEIIRTIKEVLKEEL
jgi:hypothetical protein